MLDHNYDFIITFAIATSVAALLTPFMAIILRKTRPRILEVREKTKERTFMLKESLLKKLSAGILINSKDALDIGRGLGVPASTAIHILYELLAEAGNSDLFNKVKSLIDDIERQEPFESLPEEAKPSLARISFLCHASSQGSDKELLQPIVKLLGEYQDMKRERSVLKKQGRISYTIALVSFFVGVIGLIMAFTGPSRSYISKEIGKSTKAILAQLQTETNRDKGKQISENKY